MNIKSVIKEELARLIEGDVVRPRFGGGSQSPFLRILIELEDLLTGSLDAEESNMREEEVAKLENLLQMIHDLQSGGRPPRGGGRAPAATDKERAEVARMLQRYGRD